MEADHQSIHGQAALSFANHLVAGRFRDAHALLSMQLQEALAPPDLSHQYLAMIAYGDGPANLVELISTMQTWPDRQAHDFGWAYVAISGDSFSEAIAVVVCLESDQAVIRDIEWGRP